MSLNVALIAETFARAKRENGGLTTLGMAFYTRLFEKYPQVRPLFSTPPEEQHKKLMAALAAIVGSVTQPEKMVPYLQAMGIRHVAYGTEPAHYGAVAENLLAVLQAHLSAEGAWTQEMYQAWADALTAVADIMIAAANDPGAVADNLAEAGYQADGFKANDPTPWVLAGV